MPQAMEIEHPAIKLGEEVAGKTVRTLTRNPKWFFIADQRFAASPLLAGLAPDRIRIVSPDVLPPTDGLDSGRNYLVCMVDMERLFVRHLRSQGLPALGLFGEVARRQAAFSPPRFHLDEKSFTPPRQRLAVMSLPRSASTVLALEMTAIGLGAPVEHIQNSLVQVAQNRQLTQFSFREWRRMLEHSTMVDGVFSTKIIWDFLQMFRGSLLQNEVEDLESFLDFDGYIHILREDKADQAVSDYLAHRTKVWHKWPGAEAEYEARLAQVSATPDFDVLKKTYRKFSESEKALQKFLKGRSRVIQVSFEEVGADPAGVAARIAAEFGHERADTPRAKDAPTLSPTRSAHHQELAAKLRAMV